MIRLLLAIFLLFPTLAFAQSQRNPCYNTGTPGNCVPVGTTTPLPVQSNVYNYKNMSVNGNVVLKASAGVFGGVIVNTAGATSTLTVYDDLACSSNIIGTFSTTSQTSISVNATTNNGICVVAAGGTPANITVLWR